MESATDCHQRKESPTPCGQKGHEMKTWMKLVIVALLWMGPVAGIGGGIAAGAAAAPGVAGKWLGIIKTPGMDLRIAFEISAAKEGGYAAAVHSVDQGAMNIPITTVTVNGDNLRLELKSVFAYEGKLQPDGVAPPGSTGDCLQPLESATDCHQRKESPSCVGRKGTR